jgi:hypothetical protein
MKTELIDILESYGIEDAKQEAIIKKIHQLIKSKFILIDEGSLNGECNMIILSGGEGYSFKAGWKRYEKFIKSYLEI